MNASCISEDIDHHRRRFFCTAAMGFAATAGAFSLLPEHSAVAGISQPSNQGIQPWLQPNPTPALLPRQYFGRGTRRSAPASGCDPLA